MKSKILKIVLFTLFTCGFGNAASHINSNETITVTIKGVPQMEQIKISAEYVVDSNGNLYMPFIKNGIKASGLSSSALARRIEAAYRAAEIYTTPRITIITARDEAERGTIIAKTVTIGGKVRRPGPVAYQEGMTLYQAVMAAGDATEFGAMNRVELFRSGKRYVYDLKSVESEAKLLRVYANDTITVPQTNWRGQ